MSAARILGVLLDVIPLASTSHLVVVLDAIAVELGTRLHVDARNHVVRAAFCVRADLEDRRPSSATSEPPPGA